MRNTIKLTTEYIEQRNENALALFYSGVKSKEILKNMERNLKQFLVEACADLLKGEFNERAQQFVNLTR